MRLIDADELRKQMKELLEKRAEEANMTGDRAVCVTWNDAVIFIKNAPTIDAVPVVRCKDCESYGTDGNRLNCNVFCCTMPKNGFCSMGERKDNGRID